MKAFRTVLLLTLLGALRAHAQVDPQQNEQVVVEAFKSKGLPAPALGWILPNGELVTEVNSDEVTILAEHIAPKTVPRIAPIRLERVLDFVKKNQIDCDQLDEEKPKVIYRYDAKMPNSKVATQVFVLPGRLSFSAAAGLEEYKASDV